MTTELSESLIFPWASSSSSNLLYLHFAYRVYNTPGSRHRMFLSYPICDRRCKERTACHGHSKRFFVVVSLYIGLDTSLKYNLLLQSCATG